MWHPRPRGDPRRAEARAPARVLHGSLRQQEPREPDGARGAARRAGESPGDRPLPRPAIHGVSIRVDGQARGVRDDTSSSSLEPRLASRRPARPAIFDPGRHVRSTFPAELLSTELYSPRPLPAHHRPRPTSSRSRRRRGRTSPITTTPSPPASSSAAPRSWTSRSTRSTRRLRSSPSASTSTPRAPSRTGSPSTSSVRPRRAAS